MNGKHVHRKEFSNSIVVVNAMPITCLANTDVARDWPLQLFHESWIWIQKSLRNYNRHCYWHKISEKDLKNPFPLIFLIILALFRKFCVDGPSMGTVYSFNIYTLCDMKVQKM